MALGLFLCFGRKGIRIGRLVADVVGVEIEPEHDTVVADSVQFPFKNQEDD